MKLNHPILLSFALLVSTGSAFSPMLSRHVPPGSRSSSCVLRSEPSDTSSDSYLEDDDTLTVESQAFVPTDAEALVTNVLDLVPSHFGEVSETTRSTINEILLKLEALNPTKEPTMSPLLNGVWELRYAAGYSSEGAMTSPTR